MKGKELIALLKETGSGPTYLRNAEKVVFKDNDADALEVIEAIRATPGGEVTLKKADMLYHGVKPDDPRIAGTPPKSSQQAHEARLGEAIGGALNRVLDQRLKETAPQENAERLLDKQRQVMAEKGIQTPMGKSGK